jgi:hypothetical protein
LEVLGRTGELDKMLNLGAFLNGEVHAFLNKF